MKFLLRITLSIVAVVLAIYVSYLILLGMSIKKASKKASEWENDDLFKHSFAGKIHLDNTQNLDCQMFLEIISLNEKQPESITICPCKNIEFTQFALSGDSINKQENTFIATIIKSNGLHKKFELPLCK